jgi:hypothetical protein
VLEHVSADHRARIGGLQPGEVGIVEDVTDQIDPVGGLEVGVDDVDPARLQGTEHQLVDVGLLDLAEVPGGGAEVEKRRQLFRAEFGQCAAEPFGIAAHHVGWLAVGADTKRSCKGGCRESGPLNRFSFERQHAPLEQDRFSLHHMASNATSGLKRESCSTSRV